MTKELIESDGSSLAEFQRAIQRDKLRIAELEAALRPFVFGDPAIEKILFGDMPDDATGTVTVRLRDIRRARAAAGKS